MAKVIRRNTVSIGTVGAMAAMKPRPPSPRHNSLLGDLTNQATGLLSGKGAGAEHEVARLSSKIMDLMAQLHQRDAEKAQLESALDAARKEAANARSLLNAGAPAAAPAAEAPMPAAPARNRTSAPRPKSGAGSPMRKDVMLKVLSAALREADQTTAMKTEELAAARAMLVHRSRGPSPSVSEGSSAPAPGVVAKLQAELAEAAEERRNLREQLKALRERLKDSQGQLTERSNQLSDLERERERLQQQAGQASNSAEDKRQLLAECVPRLLSLRPLSFLCCCCMQAPELTCLCPLPSYTHLAACAARRARQTTRRPARSIWNGASRSRRSSSPSCRKIWPASWRSSSRCVAWRRKPTRRTTCARG